MQEYLGDVIALTQPLPQPLLILHIVAAIISLIAIKYFLIPLLTSQLIKRHKAWGQAFERYSPFRQIQYIIPLMFIDDGISTLALYGNIVKYLEVIIAISGTLLIVSSFKTIGGIYRLYPIAKKYPIASYIELLNLITYILGGLIIFSLLLDKSPVYLLSGLGALTAVLMLIFQDTIKSFIAGVQIGTSNLIQEEDWIEVPSLGVSGTVQNVQLHFIEVRNFDNTTTIVPTYKVIDGSFKNWRSVFELDARRIVTAFNIDHMSITTLDKKQLEQILHHPELSLFSKINLPQQDSLSNLMLFRVYAERYIKQHADISGDFTTMTRLLDSSPEGIPLQLYCFSKVTSWVDYEKVKSQIVEHLLSVMPLFKLKVMQLQYTINNKK